MQPGIDALHLYAELLIAFVAFAAIVATLNQTLGNKLTALQYMIFRWLVEVGLLHLFVGFITIVLATVVAHEADAWRYSTVLIVVLIPGYTLSYLRRRLRLRLPIPASSKLVVIGTAVFMLFLLLTLTEWIWRPSLEAILSYFAWSLASLFVVFIQFLALFIETDAGSPGADALSHETEAGSPGANATD